MQVRDGVSVGVFLSSLFSVIQNTRVSPGALWKPQPLTGQLLASQGGFQTLLERVKVSSVKISLQIFEEVKQA